MAVVFVAHGAGGGPGRALLVPFGPDPACSVLGANLAHLRTSAMFIGPRAACDALWAGVGGGDSRICYDQRLYVCRAVSAGPEITVRPSTMDEAYAVARMSAEMMREDLGEDPRELDAQGHFALVARRIRAGRTWLGFRDGEAVFKVDVGTQFDLGCQVGGTWVPPEHRGQGLATAGMRAVCRSLLEETGMVTLHVNEANLSAVRCYEKAGFERDAPFRLLSV